MLNKKISFSAIVTTSDITTTSSGVSMVIGYGNTRAGMTNQIGSSWFSKNPGTYSLKIENITINENMIGKYIIVRYAGYNVPSTATIEYSDSQIEIGEIATSFEPYFNQTTNIYLNEPLRKIGDVLDYIDFKKQKVVRKIGNVILQGSEDIRIHKDSYIDTIGFKFLTINSRDSSQGYSNFFIRKHIDEDSQHFWIGTDSSVIYINRAILASQDVNGFKNWLSTHNTEVIYQLETPTEEIINLPKILLAKDTQKISIDTKIPSSKFKIKYKRK